nr:hypothetical protein Iba_chr10cCG7160 [Ipomoea batatas]
MVRRSVQDIDVSKGRDINRRTSSVRDISASMVRRSVRDIDVSRLGRVETSLAPGQFETSAMSRTLPARETMLLSSLSSLCSVLGLVEGIADSIFSLPSTGDLTIAVLLAHIEDKEDRSIVSRAGSVRDISDVSNCPGARDVSTLPSLETSMSRTLRRTIEVLMSRTLLVRRPPLPLLRPYSSPVEAKSAPELCHSQVLDLVGLSHSAQSLSSSELHSWRSATGF